MPNTAKFLINDVHLLPLLQWYLQEVEPSLSAVDKLDDKHYEYIKGTDGCIAGIRPDVVCREKAGSYNIIEGYWRTLAQSLKQNDEVPQSIRVISFINHSDIHWTSSVATFTVDQDIYRKLKQALKKQYTREQIEKFSTNELQHFINSQFPEIDIFHSFEIKGAETIAIDHYDSHSPGNPRGRYFSYYLPTLKELTDANAKNGINLSIQSKACKQQLGNTCGDYSVFNGFSAGILGLDVGDKSNQMDSVILRSLSEHVIPKLSSTPSDEQHVLKAEQKIKDLIERSKEVAVKLKEVAVLPSTKKVDPIQPQFMKAKQTQGRKRSRSTPSTATVVTAFTSSQKMDEELAADYLTKIKSLYSVLDWSYLEKNQYSCQLQAKNIPSKSFAVECLENGIRLQGENQAIVEMMAAIKVFDELTTDEEELVFDLAFVSMEDANTSLKEIFKQGVEPRQIENLSIAGVAIKETDRQLIYKELTKIEEQAHTDKKLRKK